MPIGYDDVRFPWQAPIGTVVDGPSHPLWAEVRAPDVRSMVEAAKVQLLIAARDAMLQDEIDETKE